MKDLMPTITSVDNCFHDGNPATGEQGTRVTAQFLNDVQDHIRDVEAELKYVLSKAGLNPNDAKTTQVYDAIIAIINANRRSASTTSKGEVQLTDSINMASSVFGASAFAVKTAYDKGVQALNAANGKLAANGTAVAANKLANARTIELTGAVSGSGKFDGSGNLFISTVDNLTIGLVTNTTATGTSNTATSNNNTYLNVVEKRGTNLNAVGSSTKVTGYGLVDVYSDATGVLTIHGNQDVNKLDKTGNQELNGKLTVDDILLAANNNKSLSKIIDAINKLFTGDRDAFKGIVNGWGTSGTTPLGISYDFTNANAWWIKFGALFGGLIIQGGNVTSFALSNNAEISIRYPINFSKNSLTPILSSTAGVVPGGSADSDNGAFIRYTDKTIFIISSPWMNMTSIYYGPLRWIAFGI